MKVGSQSFCKFIFCILIYAVNGDRAKEEKELCFQSISLTDGRNSAGKSPRKLLYDSF